MPKLEIPTLNKNYKPIDKETNIIQWVVNRKRAMEDSQERKRAERIWDAGEKAWDQWRAERDGWQSNYYVPLTTSVVESILAEMIEKLPMPFIIGRGDEDTPRAMVMQFIYEYSWDIANGDDEMMNVMRGLLQNGTAIAQEYYWQDKRMVKMATGLSEKNKRKQRFFTGEEKEILEYDDVMLENVSLWDILVDEKAREFNRGPYKARDCIRRYILDYRDAEIAFKGDPFWDHLNNFRFVMPGSGDTAYREFFKPPEGFDKSNDVEILWYWSRSPEDLLVVLINGVPVRFGPNPYKHKQLPFAKAIDVKRLNKFYGKGEPELLSSIQGEVNLTRRMMIDRHHLDIDKSFVVKDSAMLDEDDLISRPHGIIPGDPSEVKPLEYGDIPISVERTLKSINEDKIAVTGVDDRFSSVQKAPSTATEAAILKESTLKRIRMKMRGLERGFMVDVGRMRLANIMQFYSQPRLERIVGEQKTKEFKKQMEKLMSQGLVEMREGELFKKSFRKISSEGKKLVFDERGNPGVKREPGFHFFEAHPKLWLPTGELGFDIRFEAGPSLPVSKPLLQSKLQEAFDRIVPFLGIEGSNYDIEKTIDELIIKPAEINPEILKTDEAVEEGASQENRLALIVDLASQENQLILQGKDIQKFGTPFAPPPHTQIHIEFLKSPQMKEAGKEQFVKLMQHVQGEILAIERRGGSAGAGQQAGEGGQQQLPAGGSNEGEAATPALIQGGGQVPTGRALGNG